MPEGTSPESATPQREPVPTRLPHPEGIGPTNRTRFTLMASYPEEDVSMVIHPDILPGTLGLRVAYQSEVLARILAADFDGATVTHTTGLYDKQTEAGFRAEVIVSLSSDPDAGNRLLGLAEELAIDWEQEEVWLTSEPISLFRLKGTDA